MIKQTETLNLKHICIYVYQSNLKSKLKKDQILIIK
jgi:hypothetical protein